MDPEPLSFSLNSIAMEGAFVLNVSMLIILLFCSALISGAEVAFFGLSPTDINTIEQDKTAKGNIVVKLLERPKKLLATILIANNAINIGVVLIFNLIGDTLFSNINYFSVQFYFGTFSFGGCCGNFFDSDVWRDFTQGLCQ